jgi:hypothetical protein
VTVAEEKMILLIQEEPVYNQDSTALIYGFIKPIISMFNLMFSDMIDANNFTKTNAVITVYSVLRKLHCISFRAASK